MHICDLSFPDYKRKELKLYRIRTVFEAVFLGLMFILEGQKLEKNG